MKHQSSPRKQGLFCVIIFALIYITAPLTAQKVQQQPRVQQGIVMVRLRPGFSLQSLQHSLGASAKIPRPILRPEQSLTFNPKIALQTSISTSAQYEAIRLAEEPILRTFSIEYGSNESPSSVCKRLGANPAVEIVEPKYIEQILSAPDDPEINKQVYLNVVRAVNVWETYTGDSNVVIGICDNGILKNHEDLTGNIARNWAEIPDNNKDDDNNGYIDDYDGVNLSAADDGTKPGDTYVETPHGTDVAGVAGATFNNALGLAGTGGRCRIYPIKAGKRGAEGVFYGYEGIVYAAIRGFSVVNCSWGSPNSYSELNRSFVNFALSRGTAVVAAGGNDSQTALFYPAAYYGVLGVGETDIQDKIANSSSYGAHVRIMAPGRGAYTTTNGNGYAVFTGGLGGTSAASPMAAAHVAMIRAKHPSLDPFQAVEFARICGDDIRSLNPYYANLLPLRMNMLTALQRDPFSRPAISPIEEEFTVRGEKVNRFLVGDTISMTIKVKNYLGNAEGLRFELSQPDIFQSFGLLDSVVTLSSLAGGATGEIGPFRFVVIEYHTSTELLKVDIEANADYEDFFLFPITPSLDVTTFSNDAIAFSVGDNGSFGYAGEGSSLRGGGFLIKPIQNTLYISSYSGYSTALVATADNQKAVAAFPARSDFGARKLLVAPDAYVSELVDSLTDTPEQRVGIQIHAEYLVNSGTLPVAKIALKATNITDAPIANLALGYYFDWDIGNYGSDNNVRLYPEGLATGIGEAVAMFARREGAYPFIGVASQSTEQGAIPQAAGLDRDEIFQFTDQIKQELYAMMNSGTALQFGGTSDIAMAVGMKFPGELAPDSSKQCNICIAAAMDESVMRNALQQCLTGKIVGVEESPRVIIGGTADVSIFPQPATDRISLTGTLHNAADGHIEVRLVDALGRIVTVVEMLSEGGRFTGVLDTQGLSDGIYQVVIAANSGMISAPVVIIR